MMDKVEAGVEELTEWELAVLDLFVSGAQLIGFPKSIGQIYGLLFCADGPIPMDAFVDRLGLSKGSVSQGLSLLRQLGAVKIQFVAGDRRDHYVPEVKLRRLFAGFLREKVDPHLESGVSRLSHLNELIDTVEGDQQEHAKERVRLLEAWHKQTRRLLPLLRAVIGR